MFHSVERSKSGQKNFDRSDTDLKSHSINNSDLIEIYSEETKLIQKYIQIANTKLNVKANVNHFTRDFKTKVNIYAIFQKIVEIDNIKEQFKANVFVVATWEDDTVVETTFDTHKYWTPEIYIENTVGKVKQDVKYKIEKINKKTIIHEMRNVESLFWERYLSF